LLIDALELTERDSHVLLSTNCSALREHALEVMARYCLKATRRAATFHRSSRLPDFPQGAAQARFGSLCVDNRMRARQAHDANH
jgi:hypothetical protein